MLASVLAELAGLGWSGHSMLWLHALAGAACLITLAITAFGKGERRAERTRAAAVGCCACIALAWLSLALMQFVNARGIAGACRPLEPGAALSKLLAGSLYATVFGQFCGAAFGTTGWLTIFVHGKRATTAEASATGFVALAGAPLSLALVATFFITLAASSRGLHAFADVAFTPPTEKAAVLRVGARACEGLFSMARTAIGAGVLGTLPVTLWAAHRIRKLGFSAKRRHVGLAAALAFAGVVALGLAWLARAQYPY